MSSKPASGINHNEFGVTSEGVNTFLDIDPHNQSFAVNMTGGPDGDVTGNVIKIITCELESNTKIVGIADGSGCVEDPEGLDQEELLSLADKDLSI